MQSKSLSFTCNARYFILGDINDATETLWVALHGQGQLATYFARKFEPLVNETTAVVVPEGLSKYYLDGMSGRVGAIWMTKEDRLSDIQNYIAYLNEMWGSLPSQSFKKVIVLGFSQGAATASRWVTMGNIHPTHLVLWAGLFPPDLPAYAGEKLRSMSTHMVYGTDDPYLTEERIEEQQQISERLSAEVSTITYPGDHRIDQEVLLNLHFD